MGAWGARKALQVVENAERVLAVEALCAAQALEFRRPLRPGRGVELAWEAIRQRVPFRTADEGFQDALAEVADLVRTGRLLRAVESEIEILP